MIFVIFFILVKDEDVLENVATYKGSKKTSIQWNLNKINDKICF